LTVTGAVDKNAIIFNRSTKKIVATLSSHTKKLTDVLFHSTQDIVFTSSSDKTAKVWKRDSETGYSNVHTVDAHKAEVVGCTLHPTGEFWATGSLDSTWAFHDVSTNACLIQMDAGSEVHSVNFHPDGLLLGTGTGEKVVKIWDLKTQKNVATFEGHKGAVKGLAFSENGYYLATASADNTVKLWDLRKPKNFHTIELPEDFGLTAVEWDYTGSYLAVAGTEIRIYVGKAMNHAVSLAGHSGLVTDVKWGKDAQFLASTSMDRSLKFWGKKE